MKLLLDTHTFIWWLDGGKKLTKEARLAIEDPNNLAFISSATIWEISIKCSYGKLEIPGDIVQAVFDNDFLELPIKFAHAKAIKELSMVHTDPFDRMLVAQAKHEMMTIVTRDRNIAKYDTEIIRA